MAAAVVDLFIEQGSTFFRTLEFDDGVLPVPAKIDLTGFIFEGKIRKAIDSSEVILSFTCDVLDQVTDLGKMTISLTAEQTAGIVLKPQRTQQRVVEPFAYDLEMTYPSGSKERILQGVVNVSPEVTR